MHEHSAARYKIPYVDLLTADPDIDYESAYLGCVKILHAVVAGLDLHEDDLGHGYETIHKVLRTWDRDKSSLSNYAYRVLRHELISECIRKPRTAKRDPTKLCADLFYGELQQQQPVEVDWPEELTELERDVALDYLGHRYTLQQMRQLYGMTTERIQLIVAKVKQAFREGR